MSCKKIKQWLSNYLDGMLPKEKIGLIEKHLSSCGECSQEYRRLRKLEELLKAQTVFEPPQEYWDNFVHNLTKKQNRYLYSSFKKTSFSKVFLWLFRYKVPLVPAMSLLILLGLLSWYFIPKRSIEIPSRVSSIPDKEQKINFATLQKLISQSNIIKDVQEIAMLLYYLPDREEESHLVQRSLWVIEKVVELKNSDELDEIDVNIIKYAISEDDMVTQLDQLKEEYANDREIAEKISYLGKLLSMVPEVLN